MLTLGANQVATGLALVIFGAGVSSLIGDGYVGIAMQPFDSDLSRQPGRGSRSASSLFGYSPLVYFAFLVVFGGLLVPQQDARGLVLRAVGENDVSARSIGYSVVGVRYARDRLRRRHGGHRGQLFLAW